MGARPKSDGTGAGGLGAAGAVVVVVGADASVAVAAVVVVGRAARAVRRAARATGGGATSGVRCGVGRCRRRCPRAAPTGHEDDPLAVRVPAAAPLLVEEGARLSIVFVPSGEREGERYARARARELVASRRAAPLATAPRETNGGRERVRSANKVVGEKGKSSTSECVVGEARSLRGRARLWGRREGSARRLASPLATQKQRALAPRKHRTHLVPSLRGANNHPDDLTHSLDPRAPFFLHPRLCASARACSESESTAHSTHRNAPVRRGISGSGERGPSAPAQPCSCSAAQCAAASRRLR